MKIIFVSSVCSRTKYKKIFEARTKKIIDPAQKFLEQLMRGISENKNHQVVSISLLPVSKSTSNKRIYKYDEETEDFIKFIYLGFINGKITRYITSFFSTLFELWKQLKGNFNEQKIIITDPLSFQISLAARLIGKLFKVKSIAIVTDIPIFATEMKKHNYSGIRYLSQKIYETLTMYDLYKYDGYINLTEDMNKMINPTNRPSIVIEGSVDANYQYSIKKYQKERYKIFLYAGGLYEKYGIGNLVQAFLNAKLKGVQLHLYGSGEYVSKLKEICSLNDNVKYKGCVLNTELNTIEQNADLLINPRFSDEEYTKYSFPSKTLEYMTTGTPVLSTRLPGIPHEYEEYIYWFNGETVYDMQKRLEEIAMLDEKELITKGLNARTFVFKNKTNLIQGQKIIDFAKSILN